MNKIRKFGNLQYKLHNLDTEHASFSSNESFLSANPCASIKAQSEWFIAINSDIDSQFRMDVPGLCRRVTKPTFELMIKYTMPAQSQSVQFKTGLVVNSSPCNGWEGEVIIGR